MYKILFLFFINIAYSQNYVIEYEHLLYDNRDKFGSSWKVFEKLITNNHSSISYIKSIDTIFNTGENSTINQEASDYSISNFKNIEKQIYFSSNLFKSHNLADSIYKIEWEIKPEKKLVLGYDCQLARGSLRGRTYSVYFTPEIPIKNGPHKFDGLPGLILEVLSDDKCVFFKAKSIARTDDKIENIFLDKPLMSWKSFSKNFKKLFDKMLNYNPEEGVSVNIQNRDIEYNFEPDK
jgi:GLPGLI family protein